MNIDYYKPTAEDSTIMYTLLARMAGKEERRRRDAWASRRGIRNHTFINLRPLTGRRVDRVVDNYFDSSNI
jgi:hypothetical protein